MTLDARCSAGDGPGRATASWTWWRRGGTRACTCGTSTRRGTQPTRRGRAFHAQSAQQRAVGISRCRRRCWDTKLRLHGMRTQRINLEWFVPVEAGDPFNVERARGRQWADRYVRAASRRAIDATRRWPRAVERTATVEMGSRYAYRLNGRTGVVNETIGAVRAGEPGGRWGRTTPTRSIRRPRSSTGCRRRAKAGAQPGGESCVYDVRGARVRTLVSGAESGGALRGPVGRPRRRAGSPVGSGVYFYRMTTGSFSAVRKDGSAQVAGFGVRRAGTGSGAPIID